MRLGIFRSSVCSGGRIGCVVTSAVTTARAVAPDRQKRHGDQHLPCSVLQHAVSDLADFRRKILVDDLHLLLGAFQRHRDHRHDIAARTTAGRDFGTHAEANRLRFAVSWPGRRLVFGRDLGRRRSGDQREGDGG